PPCVGTTCPLLATPTVSVGVLSGSRLPSALRLVLSVSRVRGGILVQDAWQSLATTPQARLYRSARSASAACLASRFGLEPEEPSCKSASQSGARTSCLAVCTTRSFSVAIPRGLGPPFGCGLSTTRPGATWEQGS